MTRLHHAFDIVEDKCKAKMSCMKICPTRAIRVTNGVAHVDGKLCIDCGDCLVACTEGAIKPHTDPLEAIHKFKFKVAIPSPTLFGQFPMNVTPSNIIDGLLAIGFDAVYDLSLESELINLAIRDYLDDYKGRYPLISSTCPAVVRLIQVMYPDMVGQIIPIDTPRELAGRELKKLYSEAMGIPPEEIGAIYLAPCPAKVVSIKQPAEGVKSYLDLGIGISDIYNSLLAAITKLKKNERPQAGPDLTIKSAISLAWAFRGGQCMSLKPSRYISVSQLPNITRIFDDIEKGKIRGIEFLECYTCQGGCIGGPLVVDEVFVASSKIQKLTELMGPPPQFVQEEIKRRYVKGDYYIREAILPRPTESEPVSFAEKVRRVKVREEIMHRLPMINCGLCGAPTCDSFAFDVAAGKAKREDCPLLSSDRLDALREMYGIDTPSGE